MSAPVDMCASAVDILVCAAHDRSRKWLVWQLDVELKDIFWRLINCSFLGNDIGSVAIVVIRFDDFFELVGRLCIFDVMPICAIDRQRYCF